MTLSRSWKNCISTDESPIPPTPRGARISYMRAWDGGIIAITKPGVSVLTVKEAPHG